MKVLVYEATKIIPEMLNHRMNRTTSFHWRCNNRNAIHVATRSIAGIIVFVAITSPIMIAVTINDPFRLSQRKAAIANNIQGS